MTTRRTRHQQTLMNKSTALAVATPQVVAHRLLRMAQAGPVLSARDRREFSGMVSEKSAAFFESWTAMWFESMKVWASMATVGFSAGPWSASRWANEMATASLGVAAKGMGPVQRRATANSKRLARLR